MDNYISVKLIKAERMLLGNYNKTTTRPINGDYEAKGYCVHYPDGYVSWCPKEQFEKSNLAIGDDPTRINADVLETWILNADVKSERVDDKTTLVKCKSLTGFMQYATSSCVKPENYDEELGKKYAMNDIRKQLWFALGFVLQWATYGLNYKQTINQSDVVNDTSCGN